jgi:hypothetical protein
MKPTDPSCGLNAMELGGLTINKQKDDEGDKGPRRKPAYNVTKRKRKWIGTNPKRTAK